MITNFDLIISGVTCFTMGIVAGIFIDKYFVEKLWLKAIDIYAKEANQEELKFLKKFINKIVEISKIL